jgi:DNA-binding NarL/FixJ family response regulator
VTAFVACADRARHDLVAYWLANAGLPVSDAELPDPRSLDPERAESIVVVTDRFGGGIPGEEAILALKERWPSARVIVLGRGGRQEMAQLSLARVAGMDATLASPLDRERLLALVLPD